MGLGNMVARAPRLGCGSREMGSENNLGVTLKGGT